jgi:hypothetical protein
MPVRLSPEVGAEIFINIKKSFSDFKFFDKVEEPLRKLMDDVTTSHDINYEKTKNVLDYIPNRDQYKTKDQVEILNKFRIILCAALILIFATTDEAKDVTYKSVDELLTHYPAYKDLQNSTLPDERLELQYLLSFRNYMAIALLIITPKSNKLFLLKVIERLEGSNNEYVTGSGQKASTTRRLEIYQREGSRVNPVPIPKAKPVSSSLKRRIEETNPVPLKSETKPSNFKMSQESTSSISSFPVEEPLSQSTVIDSHLFERTTTGQILAGKEMVNLSRFAQLQSDTPDISRSNSIIRAHTMGFPALSEDEEKRLESDPYEGSFTERIQQNIINKHNNILQQALDLHLKNNNIEHK